MINIEDKGEYFDYKGAREREKVPTRPTQCMPDETEQLYKLCKDQQAVIRKLEAENGRLRANQKEPDMSNYIGKIVAASIGNNEWVLTGILDKIDSTDNNDTYRVADVLDKHKTFSWYDTVRPLTKKERDKVIKAVTYEEEV